jgi:hypothetical protein
MNWSELTNGVRQVWQSKPGIIVLIGLGFVVFVIIVLDAHRQRKKHKSKHPRKY